MGRQMLKYISFSFTPYPYISYHCSASISLGFLQFSNSVIQSRGLEGLWAKVDQWLVFKIKFYWSTAMPISLYIVYDYFCIVIAQFSNCNRDPQNSQRLKYLLPDTSQKFTGPRSRAFGSYGHRMEREKVLYLFPFESRL